MNYPTPLPFVVILHPEVDENSATDVSDVTNQAQLVKNALTDSGYSVVIRSVEYDFYGQLNKLRQENPAFVFNLVEEVYGKSELQSVIPACMSALKIPFSGASAESLCMTTNKMTTKRLLKAAGLPTPQWIESSQSTEISPELNYIIKPISEEGSVCLDEYSICPGSRLAQQMAILSGSNTAFFAEELLTGREFNISALGYPGHYEVLPVAEMIYHNFPKDKVKILGYRAKWEEGSFEYQNTSRQFHTLSRQKKLEKQLKKIVCDCGNLFQLEGYFRVDFRLDEKDKPYVLEINANPCIAPDSGFIAAANEYGLTISQTIQKIIQASPSIPNPES